MRVDFRQLSWRLCVVMLITGCGGGPDFPETAPVSGTVTFNGAPVEGATVSFSPEGTGTAAAGMTDAEGSFTLTSFQSGDGAVPGKYKVMITKSEQSATVSMPEVTADNPGAAYLAAEAAGANPTGYGGAPGGASAARPKDLLPSRYASPDSSGLSAEVNKGSDNTFTFDLKP